MGETKLWCSLLLTKCFWCFFLGSAARWPCPSPWTDRLVSVAPSGLSQLCGQPLQEDHTTPQPTHTHTHTNTSKWSQLRFSEKPRWCPWLFTLQACSQEINPGDELLGAPGCRLSLNQSFHKKSSVLYFPISIIIASARNPKSLRYGTWALFLYP